MRLVLGSAVLVCAALAAAPVAAVDGLPSTVVDDSSVEWRLLTEKEYLADPRVQDFERVVNEVIDGPLRIRKISESEGDYFREYVTYRSGLTRTAERDWDGDWRVWYYDDDRLCSRNAPSRVDAALRRDKRSAFDCRRLKKSESVPSGAVQAASALPSSWVRASDDVVYLLRVDEEPPKKEANATLTMMTRFKDAITRDFWESTPGSLNTLSVAPHVLDVEQHQWDVYSGTSQWLDIYDSGVPTLKRRSPL